MIIVNTQNTPSEQNSSWRELHFLIMFDDVGTQVSSATDQNRPLQICVLVWSPTSLTRSEASRSRVGRVRGGVTP